MRGRPPPRPPTLQAAGNFNARRCNECGHWVEKRPHRSSGHLPTPLLSSPKKLSPCHPRPLLRLCVLRTEQRPLPANPSALPLRSPQSGLLPDCSLETKQWGKLVAAVRKQEPTTASIWVRCTRGWAGERSA